MIAPAILLQENITPPLKDGEDFEYVRKVERVTLFNKEPIDQHDLAYTVFKSAKYVNVINEYPIGQSGFIYVINVTYPSPEEREYEDAYGDDYDDFDY